MKSKEQQTEDWVESKAYWIRSVVQSVGTRYKPTEIEATAPRLRTFTFTDVGRTYRVIIEDITRAES